MTRYISRGARRLPTAGPDVPPPAETKTRSLHPLWFAVVALGAVALTSGVLAAVM